MSTSTATPSSVPETAAPAEPSAGASLPPPKKRGLVPSVREWFRDPNPILVKELRTVFRTKLFIRFLYLSTGLVALIVLVSGASIAAQSMAPAQVGQIVFQFFFSMALMVLCLVAPAHAATSLTGEREMGTYESLILTGMDPARIVWGKFLASFGMFSLVLVAFAPIVGIAFLFGGISPLHVIIGFYGLILVLGPAVALGIALFVAARRLLKLHKLEKVKSIAYWSLVHHVAVVVAFLLAMGEFDDLAIFTTIPCSIGAALAFGLIRRVDQDRAAAEKEGVLEPDPDTPKAF